MSVLSVITCAGSIVGWLVLVFGLIASKGAPQEAAVAALAAALAILPYTFFRAVQLSAQVKRQTAFQEELIKRLKAIEDSLEAV